MELKSLLAVILLSLITSASGVGFSNTNDGIYVVVTGHGPEYPEMVSYSGNIRFDDGLVWSPFYPAGFTRLVYPKPSYGVKIRMLCPDGKEAVKTALGKTFGAKWDKMLKPGPDRVWDINAYTHFDPRGGGFSGVFLPAPKDLFEMKEPGTYTLDMEVQVFRYHPQPDPNTLRTNLLVFSGIRLQVEKPAKPKS